MILRQKEKIVITFGSNRKMATWRGHRRFGSPWSRGNDSTIASDIGKGRFGSPPRSRFHVFLDDWSIQPNQEKDREPQHPEKTEYENCHGKAFHDHPEIWQGRSTRSGGIDGVNHITIIAHRNTSHPVIEPDRISASDNF